MVFIWSAIIGIVAGLIAAIGMKRKGKRFVIDLLAGLSGSLLGGWILYSMTVEYGVFYKHILMSVMGAVTFLWATSFFKVKEEA